MHEFRWIWGFIKKHRYLMLVAMLLATEVALINMVNPYVQGMIVDEVIKGGRREMLLSLVLVMAGATVLKSIIRYIYQYAFEHVSQSVIYNIREQIYSRMQELDFDFFDKTRTGDIMSRMTGDLEAVGHFTSWVIFAVYFNLLTFISVMVILFTLNYKFTLVLIAIAPVTGFLTYKLARVVKPAFSAIREQFSRLNSVVQENISGNRVVKAFAKEEYEIWKFSRENGSFRQRNLDAAKIWEKYLPLLDSTAGILSVAVILVGGIMVINGSLTLGELVTFSGFIWALNNPMRMAGWIVNDIQRFAASAEKIMLMLKREPRIHSPENPEARKKPMGLVEFRNVSFCYRDERVLHNISFRAKPGQTVAELLRKEQHDELLKRKGAYWKLYTAQYEFLNAV